MLRNGRFELRSRSLCSLWCELVSSNIIVVDVVSMVRYPFLVSESLVDPVSWCNGSLRRSCRPCMSLVRRVDLADRRVETFWRFVCSIMVRCIMNLSSRSFELWTVLGITIFNFKTVECQKCLCAFVIIMYVGKICMSNFVVYEIPNRCISYITVDVWLYIHIALTENGLNLKHLRVYFFKRWSVSASSWQTQIPSHTYNHRKVHVPNCR